MGPAIAFAVLVAGPRENSRKSHSMALIKEGTVKAYGLRLGNKRERTT